MLCGEIIAVYFENHASLCEHDTQFLNVKAGGTQGSHGAPKTRNVVALIPLVQIKANLHYLDPDRRRNGTTLVTTTALFSNRIAFETVRSRCQSR
jgi:hypothetical protein